MGEETDGAGCRRLPAPPPVRRLGFGWDCGLESFETFFQTLAETLALPLTTNIVRRTHNSIALQNIRRRAVNTSAT